MEKSMMYLSVLMNIQEKQIKMEEANYFLLYKYKVGWKVV